MTIRKIQKILSDEVNSFKRFEILEHYTKHSNDSNDVLFLLNLITTDPDPMVRHEVAAQLLRLEMFRSEISKIHRKEILLTFKERIQNDNSIVVKHECLEAIGYVGDKDDFDYLRHIIENDKNEDIISTAQIALGALTLRTDKKLEPSEFWDRIYNEYDENNGK